MVPERVQCYEVGTHFNQFCDVIRIAGMSRFPVVRARIVKSTLHEGGRYDPGRDR